MKIGFLFPGQGAQSVGMGKDLYDKYEDYRKVYEKVNNITGLNVDELTFNSEEELLNQTKNTQICILTMSLAILELLKKENIEAIASSGLSLGEYTSLIYSKALSLEDGVKIVKARGELMQNLCPKGDWAMSAIIGLDEDSIIKICNEITTGFVSPANFNCPGQIVISGEKDAILQANQMAKQLGAKRTIELKTSGPFHTQMLKEAALKLRENLEKIEIHNFETTVIKNIDGTQYNEKDNVKDILANHIISPVRFENCIKEMINLGVDCFIEIGPGKTLSSFVKKINRDIKVFNINNLETLESTIQDLRMNNVKSKI